MKRTLIVAALAAALSGCSSLEGLTKGKFDNLIATSLGDDRAFFMSTWFGGLISFGSELREADSIELKRLKQAAARAAATNAPAP